MSNKNEKLIEVRQVSKYYQAMRRKRDMARKLLGIETEKIERVNVLEKITFDLNRGEAVGIIGKNGCGKSTLLQIICGTLTQTTGEVIRRGKIAALLELGSGFNMEFTGKENIYLNGMIMGLKRKEIEEKLEEIISFSGIGEFIDQPVKTYSSGMIVRLAFAIMTRVEADILVIDEALAVGDALFNQKCIRYIKEFKKKGSILFVSHDTNAVMSLCDRAILISGGKIAKHGTPKETVEHYMQEIQVDMNSGAFINDENIEEDIYKESSTKEIDFVKWKDYRAEIINQSNEPNRIRLSKVCTEDNYIDDITSEKIGGIKAFMKSEKNMNGTKFIEGGEVVELVIEAEVIKDINCIICGFIMKNEKGLTLLGDNTENSLMSKEKVIATEGSRIKATFIFTMPLLPVGNYAITVSVAEGNQSNHRILKWRNDAILLESLYSGVAAGLAGVPMHTIKMEVNK